MNTFAEAIREYGLTPDDVHTSYNLWMRVTPDSRGRRQFHWNRARKGDYLDMLVLFDTLSVPVICGSGSVLNQHDLAPVRVNVFEASPAASDLVDRIQERFGRYKSQKTPNDFKLKEIRRNRKLERDPNYEPEFFPAPRKVAIELELSADVREILQPLMKTEIYGSSEGKAVVACFMRWYNANRLTDRSIKLSFRDQ